MPNSSSNKSITYLKVAWWSIKFTFQAAPKTFVGNFIVSLVNGLQFLVDVYLYSLLIDQLILAVGSKNASTSQIVTILVAYVLVNVVVSAVNSFSGFFEGQQSMYFSNFISKQISNKVHELGVEASEDPTLNNALTRINQESFNLPSFVSMQVKIITLIIQVLVSGLLIFTILPVAGVAMLLMALIQIIPSSKFRKESFDFQYNTTEERRVAWSKLNAISSVSTLPEVLTLGVKKYFLGAFETYQFKSERFYTANQLKWVASGLIIGVLLVNIVGLLTYSSLINLALLQVITVGQLIFWVRNAYTIYYSTNQITNQINRSMERATRSIEVMEFMQRKPHFPIGSIDLPRLASGPKIEFKDFTFAYPNTKKPIYKNLNLVINPGEKIAIVGKNGAGKTTLVKLISRFYMPTTGSIEINNTDLKDIKQDEWFKNVGILMQDYQIFGSLTVKENVAIGKIAKDVDEQKVIEALKLADAWDFVKDYKFGINTLLSTQYKDGTKPSTGQSQKIAIARFFYRNAPLAIFDEPTSAIDAQSEANIFKRIYKFFKGKTVIIISHRFSTVRNADRILVIDKGEIIEQGSHEQLMELQGEYYKAFKLQAEGYGEAEQSE